MGMADPSRLRFRLSLLMFLQYAPSGAIVPLFSLRLEELGFTALQVGWGCAGLALASLIAPLVAGQVADRWVSSERCIALCAAVAGVLLWLLASLRTFPEVMSVTLAYWMVMVPALTLSIALCFAHLSNPEQQYGPVRLWGTVGWVVPIWGLAGWFALLGPDGDLADMFRVAAVLSWTYAAYALTLPHTPPARRGASWLAPLAALTLLRRRGFAVYTVSALTLCVTLPFSGQVAPLLLKHLGVPRPLLCLTLTIAQSMEVVALGLLPMILLRLGMRGTMVLGLSAWVVALTLLMIGSPLGLVMGSLTLNGVNICCFLVAGQVFVNRLARGSIRASAQGLLTFINGVGLLIGNVLTGVVRRAVDEEFPPTFAVAAVIAVVLTVGFALGFPGEQAMLAAEEEIEPSSAPNRAQ